MATKYLEPGGDADFGTALWSNGNVQGGTAPVVATDFVHGGHIKSLKFANNFSTVGESAILADAGGRISVWVYFNALPGATNSLVVPLTTGFATATFRIRITSAGVLQLWETSAQIGTNGSTLSTGTWYRLTLAWTITSTTVNQFRLFKDGVSDISVSNATISNTGTADLAIGNASGDATADIRMSDIYVDNSTALTDPGNIWVTAKRPFANGTTNGFTTQIGSGGSGYGTGHSPQVNERALSTTNGWSMVGAGSAVTEEYSIEGQPTGDIDVSAATVVDFMGWVDVKALAAETGKIIVAGVSTNISVTTSAKIFTQIAGSSTYPAGSTDIGVITSTTLTTFSLYECGIVVAYIPGTASAASPHLLSMMGAGS